MSENTTNPRVYLTETMTEAEAGVLRKWLADKASSSETRPVTVNITDKTLAELAARTDDPMLAPLRVVWIPDTHTKHNVAVRLRDALAPRDPLHPGRGAQRRTLRTDPSRCQVIEGEPAPLSDLERRLEKSGGGSLPEFIRRQAALALERAELGLLGGQYKVSRFVVDEITDTRRFTTEVMALADRLNIAVAEVDRRAREALEEMVATQSRQAIAVWDRLGRYFARAYKLDVDTSRFEELRELNKNTHWSSSRVTVRTSIPSSASGVDRERLAAQSRHGRPQHQLLAHGLDPQAQRHRLHSSKHRQRRGLQVVDARVHALPAHQTLQSGVVHRRWTRAYRETTPTALRSPDLPDQGLSGQRRIRRVPRPRRAELRPALRGRGNGCRGTRRREDTGRPALDGGLRTRPGKTQRRRARDHRPAALTRGRTQPGNRSAPRHSEGRHRGVSPHQRGHTGDRVFTGDVGVPRNRRPGVDSS